MLHCLGTEASVRFDLPPNMAHNGYPGVGGEGCSPLGIKPQNGTPQAQMTCLQGLSVG
jgi:hypothetical protein